MITLEVLQKRRDELSDTQIMCESELKHLSERVKEIKQEIANINGAIIEIDYMIESL